VSQKRPHLVRREVEGSSDDFRMKRPLEARGLRFASFFRTLRAKIL
jgi:hypothetical protein